MEREIPVGELKKTYTSGDMVKGEYGRLRGLLCLLSEVWEARWFWILMTVSGFGSEPDSPLESFYRRPPVSPQEGIVLPNLRMNGPEEACVFLNEEGRCGPQKPVKKNMPIVSPLGRILSAGRIFLLSSDQPVPQDRES